MNSTEIVEKIIAQAESTQHRLTVRLEDLQARIAGKDWNFIHQFGFFAGQRDDRRGV
jgi:hypothetical protein